MDRYAQHRAIRTRARVERTVKGAIGVQAQDAVDSVGVEGGERAAGDDF